MSPLLDPSVAAPAWLLLSGLELDTLLLPGVVIAGLLFAALLLVAANAIFRARRRMSESERRYRELFENAPVAMFRSDGEVFEMNRAFRELLGYTPEEVAGKRPSDFNPPEDRAQIAPLLVDLWNDKIKRIEIENRMIAKDGRTIWVLASSCLTPKDGDRPRVLIAHVQDVTARREAERLLTARERKYRETFQNAPIAMFRIGRDRALVDANHAFERLLGYTKAEMRGQLPVDLVHPDDAESLLTRTALVWNGTIERVENEYRVKTKDGRYIWVSTSGCLTPDDDGQLNHLLVHLEDITQRKEAEEALQKAQESLAQSEREYRELFDTAPVAMAWISPEGYYIRANRAMQELLGYSRDERVALRALSTLHPADKETVRLRMAELVKGTTDSFLEEHRHIHKDGHAVWVLASVRLIRNADGSAHHILAQLQDITARKSAEEQLFQSQKMEALGNLAGGIAHDFNNMLLPIIALTEISRDELPEESPLRENLESVLEAANHAAHLVQGILDFSRQNERTLDEIDISQCVSDALHLLRSLVPSSVAIDTAIKPAIGCVIGDRAQLNSVIMNLGSNAADAMQDRRGRILVKLADISADADLAARFPMIVEGSAYARITIRDTGSGMDEATIQKIFNPFFTTKPVGEGTGLGLAMVHGIIEGLKGAIDVTSEIGIGTTFDLYIPLSTALPESAEDPNTEALRA